MSNNKNEPVGPYASTYTGKRWYFLNPRAEDLCLEDIAHSLSNEYRFNGMTETPWSVAQHLIMAYHMTNHLELGLRRTIFMHDAPEAYCMDMVRPFRSICQDYNAHYNKTESVIFNHYKILPMTPELEIVDNRLMLTEAHLLMRKDLPKYARWWEDPKRYSENSYLEESDTERHTYMCNFNEIAPLSHAVVKARFLKICVLLDIV